MQQAKSRKGVLAKLAAVLTTLVLAMSFLPISVLGTQEAWAAGPTLYLSTNTRVSDVSMGYPGITYTFTVEPEDSSLPAAARISPVVADLSQRPVTESMMWVAQMCPVNLPDAAAFEAPGEYTYVISQNLTSNTTGYVLQPSLKQIRVHVYIADDNGNLVYDTTRGSGGRSLEVIRTDDGEATSTSTSKTEWFNTLTTTANEVPLPITAPDGTVVEVENDADATDVQSITSDGVNAETVTLQDDSDYTVSADDVEVAYISTEDLEVKVYPIPRRLVPGVPPKATINALNLTSGDIARGQAASGDIAVNKTINVPASVDLTGLAYTFDFQAAAPVANESGAFAVPNGVDIPTVTLTASNSTLSAGNDSVRTVSGTVALPNANQFGHAGVYAYTVSEAVTGANANDSWDNDGHEYKVRLYVVNDGYGGLKYADGTNSNSTDMMTIEVLKDIDGNAAGSAQSSVQAGAKVPALDFTNVYDKTVPFQVKKLVSGDYANRAHKFSFDLTLDFPDYVTSGTYAYTTSYGTNGSVTVTNGQATISGFQLAADETLDFSSLPVGTVYTVVESTPSEGVNNYVPSATYTYSGIGSAGSGYETATNSVTAGTAGATYTVNRTDGADQNLNTILGAGSGNRVDVTNTLANPLSPTGVLVQTLPFVAILAIPAILGTALYLTRRREGDEL